MKIEKIIYETCREILNLEDKLKIASIFLFCDKLGCKELSGLLYAKDHDLFIKNLNMEYADYEIDLLIDFADPNVASAFHKTAAKVKEKYDKDGFLKAISEGDEFALVICEIVNLDFDSIAFKKHTQKIKKQLGLF